MAPSLNAIFPPGDGGPSLSRINLLGVIAGVSVLSYLGLLVYRLLFHPLSKYPGPKIYALSRAPWTYRSCVSGSMAREVEKLHRQYGPIVRITPNGLAIDGAIAFPQVFQHRPGKPEWPKRKGFYFDHDHESLIASNHEEHRRLRRQLAHAFSDASMYEQEPVVEKHLDLLCVRLGEKAATGEVFDIVRWLNFMTFDIIGDLMFADSFHSLEGGDYHPWVLSVFEGVRGNALLRGLLEVMAREKAMVRKAQGEMPGGRRDFMTYMLKKNRDGSGYSDMDILLNSPLLVVAGSETTATSMTGFFVNMGLDKNRHVYNTLVEEILGAFQNEEDINMKTTAGLPYLRAVIEENLRMFPPLVETPPRVSPGAEIDGQFIPKGTLVTVYQDSTFRNPANFADPDSFRPERWLPASHPLYNPMFANDNHDSFRPFSFGVRDCLGKNLAYSELRVFIARLLYRFDYTLQPGQENWLENSRVFVTWEKPEVKVVFRERWSKTQVKAE
ncbi:hypothetical protein N0V93_000952 [Gnomoniopsis smithogilvyi]|uniref:Cytochrome P450 n=1 Tax=Gnomoniopsis smithogilvyi TaxID=1191159 RepID=A0A9W8Z0Q5_9PEZI|nr:hypothetical protein N0V93_000952 [Gnomoniopsis smithogilvyi]